MVLSRVCSWTRKPRLVNDSGSPSAWGCNSDKSLSSMQVARLRICSAYKSLAALLKTSQRPMRSDGLQGSHWKLIDESTRHALWRIEVQQAECTGTT